MDDVKVLLVSAIQKELFYRQAPRRRALGDLGIRYIASYLIDHGVQADVLPSYAYTQENLLEYIQTHDQLIGVGFSMHTISADNSLNDVRAIKEKFPHLKIWLGGFLPTFGWKFLLDTDCPFDYIMKGDGEIATLELCQKLLAGEEDFAIDGIIRRGDESTYNNTFCKTAELDTLPLPYFCQQDKEQHVGEYMISASRGCYGNCTFCSIPAFSVGRRERAVRSVVEEQAWLKREYGATFIDFVDDAFLGAKNGEERAKEFAQTTEKLDARLPYRISLRANNVTDTILGYLKEAGLLAVQLGVESFSPRQLKLYSKGVTAERAIQALRVLERNEVYVQSGLILFEPSATLDDLIINAKTLMQEPWAVVKSNAQSLFCAEGTRLSEKLKAMGGGNLGVDGYLNYRWEFLDPRVKEVREIVMEYEKKLGYFSDVLVNAITPPSPMRKEDYAQMRNLQNAYQRLSFEALYIACEGEKSQLQKVEIMENIHNRLGDKFNEIIIKAQEILEGYRHG